MGSERFSESVMAELARPASYIDKLRLAERVVKAAQYRPDQRQLIRELCEALTVLVAALLEREQERMAQAESGAAKEKPAP